ncbi:hypothetical protein ACHMW5_13635 [Azospirillum melinis]|uniref:hypothetical protein n=1 Tax=Azospirillum melinis TaxID=328839 RepID=UPI003757C16E
MADELVYLLAIITGANAGLMLGSLAICRWYWKRCQQTLSDIEALADEELSRG